MIMQWTEYATRDSTITQMQIRNVFEQHGVSKSLSDGVMFLNLSLGSQEAHIFYTCLISDSILSQLALRCLRHKTVASEASAECCC